MLLLMEARKRGGLPVMTAYSITIFFARREEFRQERERWRKYKERRENVWMMPVVEPLIKDDGRREGL
jgi:hypothetical protein